MKMTGFIVLAAAASLGALTCTLLTWYHLTEDNGWPRIAAFALLSLGCLLLLRTMIGKIARNL